MPRSRSAIPPPIWLIGNSHLSSCVKNVGDVGVKPIRTIDEDRWRIRTGCDPEDVTRLRRFAIGLVKAKGVKNVAQKIRQLNKNTRWVFDYLRMTSSSCAARPA